jgi:hypothetical protein
MSSIRLFTLDGALRWHPEVEAWFRARPETLSAIAQRWFDAMRSCGPDVAEVLHDGHPTACVGTAAFGYVNAFAEHVNVGLFPGSALRDPAKLLEGSGRFMRHAKIRPGVVIDEAALRDLIVAAYQRTKEELQRINEAGPTR